MLNASNEVTRQMLLPPSQPALPLDSVVGSLRSGIPDTEWMLREIEKQQGWFRFPSFINNAITNLKLASYPLLYVSEGAIAGAFLKGFMSSEEIQQFNTEIEAASLEERAELLEILDGITNDFVDGIHIPKTPGEQKAVQEAFAALSPEEQLQSIKMGQHFFLFFLPSFHQCLSVMVHGEKLTSLVAQAQTGNDDALVKAIQIDKRILTEMPYFKMRFARAQDEADSGFLDKVAYRLKVPPYHGKIRHKTLWLTFAILEQSGWLNHLSYRQVLEICDEVGVGGYENRIQSEKHLGSRLREYREFQKRGIVTTT